MLVTLAWAQRLNPGDRIRIVCEQEPTLSVTRVISEEGSLNLPILGVVWIAGKTREEAQALIERTATEKLDSGAISVSLEVLGDPSAPIRFYGAVDRAGSIPFREGITLDAVIKAASLGRSTPPDLVEITGADGTTVKVDLEAGGRTTRLKAGDSVYFPPNSGSSDVLILGGVETPGSKAYTPGLTLGGLIAKAGGVTGHGDPKRIKLQSRRKDVRVVDLDAAKDLPLQRGDIVTVPMVDNPRLISLAGQIVKPGFIPYREGMTLVEAIRLAGGLTLYGAADGVTVRRQGQWTRKFDLRRIATKQTPDLILLPSDSIEVPTLGLRPVSPANRPAKGKSHPVVPPR